MPSHFIGFLAAHLKSKQQNFDIFISTRPSFVTHDRNTFKCQFKDDHLNAAFEPGQVKVPVSMVLAVFAVEMQTIEQDEKVRGAEKTIQMHVILSPIVGQNGSYSVRFFFYFISSQLTEYQNCPARFS